MGIDGFGVYEIQEQVKFDEEKLKKILEEQKEQVSLDIAKRLIGESGEKIYIQFLEVLKKYPLPIDTVNSSDTGSIFDWLKTLNQEDKVVVDFYDFYGESDRPEHFPTLLYIFGRISTLTISFSYEKNDKLLGEYARDNNSIEIFLDNFNERDYSGIQNTIFHEIEHSADIALKSMNEGLVSEFGDMYMQNISKLLYKEYEQILFPIQDDLNTLHLIKNSSFERLNRLSSLNTFNRKLPGKTGKLYRKVYELPKELVDQFVQTMIDEHPYENISIHELHMMIIALHEYPSNIGSLLKRKVPLLEKNKNNRFGKYTDMAIQNTVQQIIYPEYLIGLLLHIKKKVSDKKVQLTKEQLKVEQKIRYLTDAGKFNEEYRTRIATIRNKLEQGYVRHTSALGKRLLGEVYSEDSYEYYDESLGQYLLGSLNNTSLIENFLLETGSDRREFIDKYHGLNLIEKRFGSFNRILIESFFVKDEQGNDLVHLLVELWNNLVYDENGTKPLDSKNIG